MKNNIIAGFIVNLLQDVNILRGLIYLTSDNIGIQPLILVTQSFVKRDKLKTWMNEIEIIASDTQASIYMISSLHELWQLLNSGSSGFLVSASESNLNAHKETHEIFKMAPSCIKTITLQHGFECVGFLMNQNHQRNHGSSVSFASDYICGWTPRNLQRNLRPLQYSRYQNLGPTAWISQTNKRNINRDIDPCSSEEMGIICENLHSVRFGGEQNVNLFMQQFFELAEYLNSKGEKIALRPHPGGQYTVKNKLNLPDNVIIVNQPSYKVNWAAYKFGISAPSSVLFDLMINNVPVMVWQDQQKAIDITQLAFLPVAQNVDDMTAFADFPLGFVSSSTNQQLNSIFRETSEISLNYTQFLGDLCGLSISKSQSVSGHSINGSLQKKLRVLLLAPAVIPTLTLSFLKPFSLISDLLEYKLIHNTGKGRKEGETGKLANERRCMEIINSYGPDVLIMCRYANKDAIQLSSLCKKRGIKVIYHMDDLLFDPSPDVLDAKKYNDYKKRAPTILDLIRKSDLLYSSTPALSKELALRTKHSNIFHGKIYKSADPKSIKFSHDRYKVIGYTGFGHTQDLESIEDALLEIMHEYKDWNLELIGTMEISEKMRSLGDRLIRIPPEKDYNNFISLLKSRNWSIGICPLIQNKFNSLKANTKWIEYSCCNIATIATDFEPYRYGTMAKCLLLCNSLQEWKEALLKLMNSKSLVDNLVVNSQHSIRHEYSDEALSRQVLTLIQNLVRG